jgi:ABC-type bacteriocin/lantibiotic exporter with double-glycine peptidase domain
MSMTTEDEKDRELEPLPNIDGTIEFENVEFEYDKDVPVLKGISSIRKRNDNGVGRFERFGQIDDP